MLLIDTQTKRLLAVGSPLDAVTGEWADWIKSGRARWVNGAASDPSVLTVQPDNSVILDAAKVAAKTARAAARQARRDAVKVINSATTVAQVRAVVAAIAEELGFQIDP